MRVEAPRKVVPREVAVDFVSEDDVRVALRENRTIVINEKTIVTPAAQDLGGDRNVLVGEDD